MKFLQVVALFALASSAMAADHIDERVKGGLRGNGKTGGVTGPKHGKKICDMICNEDSDVAQVECIKKRIASTGKCQGVDDPDSCSEDLVSEAMCKSGNEDQQALCQTRWERMLQWCEGGAVNFRRNASS